MLTSWQTVSFSQRPWNRRAGFISRKALDVYSGGTPFESQYEILNEVFCGFPHSPQEDASITAYASYATTASLHIPSNSSFTNHPTIDATDHGLTAT
jgi:hypothetical protein